MKKIILIICLSVIAINSLNSQIIPKNRALPKQHSPIIRANLFAPIGFHLFGSAEITILPKLTIMPQLGLVSAFGFTKESNDPALSNSSTVGFFSVELRRYVNLYHRYKKKKNINNYSGNYFALKYFASTPPFAKSNQSYNFESIRSIQVHYGFQREINKRFFWGGNIGLAVDDIFLENSQNSRYGLFPLLQFGVSVGYTF
ncbi:hypothetical protein [Sediminibacterium sp.]|uniref:hypothetical protein n=1 Tax=Sediminibacterium sp. TaxID=1917865 RepID=UPI002730EC9A|nr:hypothetical protein [Sediminibacterium sp.]MDP2420479.1 hypothetical protein [Sediminibacterium sp.]